MVELTALSSRSVRAIATYLNFYVSHDSTAKFLRGSENVIFFGDKSLLFPTVKEFSKSVNSRWSYRKKFDTTFFEALQCRVQEMCLVAAKLFLLHEIKKLKPLWSFLNVLYVTM